MDALAIKHGEAPEDIADDDDSASRSEDSEVNRRKLNQLQSWLQHERDRQSENRYEMAKDGDYYDGLQWDEAEAQEVEARGQAPLVFNETKVTIDWIIGTEKRNRVDWKVLPREESDQEAAATKTKVLKYVSDVNRVPFTRSHAFAESAISGLSWIEDSLSTDPTEDILYSGAESWRYVLHDSYHRRLDGRDMRYLFRWKHLDLDVAQSLFADHKEALERASMNGDQLMANDEDALWYIGEQLRDGRTGRAASSRGYTVSVGSMIESARRRVKVYEVWYREPTSVEIVCGGAYDGTIYDPRSEGIRRSLQSGWCDVMQKTILRVRCAYMLDGVLLEDFESPFSHNDLPFTPIYCFRRQRDGLPYGHARNIRDPQTDLNKRMSKSLFLLSTNQLITEKGAFAEDGEYTLQDAIDNVSNPNGVFVLKDGTRKFEIRRDYAEMQSQMQLVAMDRQFMQSGSGVTDELLGRRTNATSGIAINARQEQGSATTAGIFDNYRLAISLSGQKQLSNAEKFYTLPKVIRLTEPKTPDNEIGIGWATINEPEIQADGSVRFLNDITATKADFIVDEQDYRASMRQSMFDSLIGMIQHIAPIAPNVAIGMLDLLIDLNDFPGKEEMVARAKQLMAEAKGQPTTPQEAEQQQQAQVEQAAKAAEMEALAKRAAAAEIAKNEAETDKKDAEADKIRAEIPLNAVAVDLERTPQAAARAQTGHVAAQPAVAPLAAPLAPLAPLAPTPSATTPQLPPPAFPHPSAGSAAPGVEARPSVDPLAAELQDGLSAALDAVATALNTTQQTQQSTAQTQQMIAETMASMQEDQRASQERAAYQFASITQALQELHEPAQPQAAAPEPEALPDPAPESEASPAPARAKAKRITIYGPDGKPITATVETVIDENGAASKRITLPGQDGKPVTAIIETLE